ncbi:MAG: nitroreductase family protein [Gaiellaceae bacterium]
MAIVDTYLAVASKRDERRYADRPLPADVVDRILDAGRLAGSAGNRQPWRFLLIETPELRDRVAETVYAPANVRTAALAVALAVAGKGPTAFDAGRAAQNMMLTAWSEGVASCPNGVAEPERAAGLLGLGDDDRLVIVLGFGYAARRRDPDSQSAAEWSARANRKPLGEVVVRLP